MLLVFVAAFLILGLFLVWALLNHDYEAWYLTLGNLLLRGEISLYQDELTGQWVPMPFWFYGLSQLVFGPSLLAARLLSTALGVVTLVMVFALARRWGGRPAAAVAAGLFCTHGLLVSYFVSAHFASLVAVVTLAAIWILFETRWPWRAEIAMAVASILFLIKPHYWPALPFFLAFVLWRTPSLGRRAVLVGLAGVIPVVFFLWDIRHLKMLSFVPVVQDLVEPFGFRPFHSLHEDPTRVWGSDYVDIVWDTSFGGRLRQLEQAFGFLLKRYAVWIVALVALAGLALVQRLRERGAARPESNTGLRFTFWLFCYLVAWQFVIVGPYIKQSFAYVGAIAPLLAICVGCLFSRAWARAGLVPRPVLVAGIVAALATSPFLHRPHNLPRVFSAHEAALPAIDRVAARLAALLPAGEGRVFLLGDPLPVHLAGRRAYLRQFHQHYMAFTSVTDRARYVRSGMWGPAEIEDWLGHDARYAVIQPRVLEYYRSRQPYGRPVARIEQLLSERFELLETIPGRGGEDFRVLRRRAG